jgi:flagellar FliL protein
MAAPAEKTEKATDVAVAPAKPVPEEKAKGSSILFLILLGINLIFMGATAFVVWKSNKLMRSRETVQDIVEGMKKTETDEKATAKSEADKLLDIVLIPIDTFVVNLAGDGGARYLKVDLELELTSNDVVAELEKRKPQIRDIIITLLSSKTYDQLDSQEDKDFLREEIKNTINGFLVTGKVIKTYFSQFVIS